MSANENRKMIEDAFAAWEQRDPSAFLAIVDDQVHWTVSGSGPTSGVYHSKAALVKEGVGRVAEKLNGPMRPMLRRVLADGDWVVVQWSVETPTKSGSVYKNDFCWVMRIADGRIVECIAYFDTLAASALLH